MADLPAVESVSSISPLSELEVESIEYFVSFVQLLGLPKSVGEIYGILFVSTHPMALNGIVERLKISKGSASQGIGVLKNLGAIQKVYMPGKRQDFYEADFDLVKIFSNFYKEKLQPRLENGDERLARIRQLAENEAELTGEEVSAAPRIEALIKWQKRGGKLFPSVLKFLKATRGRKGKK